jgi:hypothetical protein
MEIGELNVEELRFRLELHGEWSEFADAFVYLARVDNCFP